MATVTQLQAALQRVSDVGNDTKHQAAVEPAVWTNVAIRRC
jgi:hypothetical protein